MASFLQNSLIDKVYENFNGFFTIPFCFFIFCIVLDVALLFLKTWRESPIWQIKRTPQLATLQVARRRQIYVFVTLAVGLAFIFNFLRLRASSFDPDSLQSSGGNRYKMITGFLRFTCMDEDGVEWGMLLDYFRRLVSNPRAFWWTSQWYMGYLSWALYVSVESRARNIAPSNVFSLIMLAYIVGLASAQCLFFALLLLKAVKGRVSAASIPSPKYAIVYSIVQALAVVSQPFVLEYAKEEFEYLPFNMLLAVVVLQPAILLTLFNQLPSVFGASNVASAKPKRMPAYVWWAISVMAALLYSYSCMAAFRQEEDEHAPNVYDWPDEEMPERTVKENVYYTAISLLQEAIFGCKTIGLDVVFSFVVVAIWAMMSSVEHRNIIKCSIFCPWLHDDQIFLKASAKRRKSTVGKAVGAEDDVQSSAVEAVAGETVQKAAVGLTLLGLFGIGGMGTASTAVFGAEMAK